MTKTNLKSICQLCRHPTNRILAPDKSYIHDLLRCIQHLYTGQKGGGGRGGDWRIRKSIALHCIVQENDYH